MGTLSFAQDGHSPNAKVAVLLLGDGVIMSVHQSQSMASRRISCARMAE